MAVGRDGLTQAPAGRGKAHIRKLSWAWPVPPPPEAAAFTPCLCVTVHQSDSLTRQTLSLQIPEDPQKTVLPFNARMRSA